MEGAATGPQRGRAGQCAQAWTPPFLCPLGSPQHARMPAGCVLFEAGRRKEGGGVLTSLGAHCHVLFECCGRRSNLVCAAGQAMTPPPRVWNCQGDP